MHSVRANSVQQRRRSKDGVQSRWHGAALSMYVHMPGTAETPRRLRSPEAAVHEYVCTGRVTCDMPGGAAVTRDTRDIRPHVSRADLRDMICDLHDLSAASCEVNW